MLVIFRLVVFIIVSIAIYHISRASLQQLSLPRFLPFFRVGLNIYSAHVAEPEHPGL